MLEQLLESIINKEEYTHVSISLTKGEKGVSINVLDKEEWRPVANSSFHDSMEDAVNYLDGLNSQETKTEQEPEEEDLL